MKNLTHKNLYLTLIGFFMIHLILQLGFMLLEFGAGMQRFEGDASNLLEMKYKIYGVIFNILSFPTFYIFSIIPQTYTIPGGLILGILPWLINSTLWTWGFYFILKKMDKLPREY